MTEYFVDNKMYKKAKWLELGICLSLLIGGGSLSITGDGKELADISIVGLMIFFLGEGLVMSWMLQALYFKKVKAENK